MMKFDTFHSFRNLSHALRGCDETVNKCAQTSRLSCTCHEKPVEKQCSVVSWEMNVTATRGVHRNAVTSRSLKDLKFVLRKRHLSNEMAQRETPHTTLKLSMVSTPATFNSFGSPLQATSLCPPSSRDQIACFWSHMSCESSKARLSWACHHRRSAP